VLYKFDSCAYCWRVFDALARLHLEIPHRDILRDPEARKTLIEVGGKRQVPCLFIDGAPLYESLDIVRWLEQHFGPG
jgi:glutathione S-transferase